MHKVRVAAVKYLNTLPLLEGLQSSGLIDSLEMHLEHPARCAELLREGAVDLALCPIGALLDLQDYRIVSDFCIGCNGAVRTVGIYSQVPLEQLKHVVLYPESRTSNLLARVLEGQFWHHGLSFGFEAPLAADPDSIGYLCIGDACFSMEQEFAFSSDLGAAWKEHTGLPFVFACWISRTALDPDFEDALNGAFAQGIESMATQTGRTAEIRHYLAHNIDFRLDTAKRKAMQLFLNAARSLPTTARYVAEDTF